MGGLFLDKQKPQLSWRVASVHFIERRSKDPHPPTREGHSQRKKQTNKEGNKEKTNKQTNKTLVRNKHKEIEKKYLGRVR